MSDDLDIAGSGILVRREGGDGTVKEPGSSSTRQAKTSRMTSRPEPSIRSSPNTPRRSGPKPLRRAPSATTCASEGWSWNCFNEK